ncbi:MAG: hypothetical protein ACKVS8_04665 [Phycisphaerales bacterium]
MTLRGMYSRGCLFHVVDLPEWKLFPSEAERDRAFADVNAGRIPGWAGFVTRPLVLMGLGGVVGVSALVGAGFLLGRGTPFVWHVGALVAASVAVFGSFFWFVHRPAVRAFARARLRALGVSVCGACGYVLSGITEESAGGGGPARVRCPECGTVDAAVIQPPANAAVERGG